MISKALLVEKASLTASSFILMIPEVIKIPPFYMNRDFLLEHNNNISQNIGNRHIVVLITCGVLYLFIIDDISLKNGK